LKRECKRPGSLAQEPGRIDRRSAESDDLFASSTIARGTWPRISAKKQREMDGMLAAAEHLNALGMAAPVPPRYVARLRSRGLAVWPGEPRRAA
jgi:hypothetical protein